MRANRSRRGVTTTEYVVVIGLVAIVAILGVRVFGKSVFGLVGKQADRVTSLEGMDGAARGVDTPPPKKEAPKADDKKNDNSKEPPKKDAPAADKKYDGPPRAEVVAALAQKLHDGAKMSLAEINSGKLKDGTNFTQDELAQAVKKNYEAVLKANPIGAKAQKDGDAKQKAEDEKKASDARVKAELAKASLALAKDLVSKGGSGTQADVDLVVAELAKLPPIVLQMAKENGVKVIACRNSITDYRTELKGVRPRGWPPGSSWDTVPGVQAVRDGHSEVTIATIDAPGGKRQIGTGHGATNLVLHEFGHAMDEVFKRETGTKGSLEATFQAARERDKDKLAEYFRQAGEAGASETFAESFAAYYSNKPGFDKEWPAVADYWSKPLQPILDARKKKK